MKKIYSLLFLLTALTTLSSCTNEVDDVFDKSSAERIEETIKSYKDILVAAPNGWRMAYKTADKYGGYNVLCKFNADNTVDVANEKGDQTNGTHYQVMQSQGVLLSFDEYNQAIHRFSDPVAEVGKNGLGYEGDFEFRVLKASADTVVLEGKKHGGRIVMTPMARDRKWTDYLKGVDNMKEAMDAPRYRLSAGGKTFDCQIAYNVLKVKKEDGNILDFPFAYTDKGLDLLQADTLAGKTISGFLYSEGEAWADKNDNSVQLAPVYPPLSEAFVTGNWTLSLSKSSTAVAGLWKAIADLNARNGYPVVYAYFGTDTEFSPNFGLSLMLDNLVGQINIGYTLVDAETITFTGKTGGVEYGNAFYSQLAWKNALTTLMPGNEPGTYKIKANATKNPTEMTLTNTTNDNIVMVFDKGQILNPFN